MNAMVETLNTAGRAFIGFATPMLIQSSLLILILLAVDAVLRKRVRAVFRYWIWMLVLVKLMLPPSLWSPVSVGMWLGDKLEVSTVVLVEPPELPPVESPKIELPPTVASALSRPQRMFVEPPLPDPAIAPPSPLPTETANEATPIGRPPASSLNWQGFVLLIWAAVVVAMLLLLTQRTFFVQGLVAQADEASGAMLRELDQCRLHLGLRKPVSLRFSPNAASPAVCGLGRPVILVPQNFASRLHGTDLQAVLYHELAHVKRGDLWVNLVQALLQIVYFYSPLLWVANAVIRRIREKAVDETVLVALGESAPQYPETLVNVAKLALTRRPTLSLRLIGVVESKSALTSRIKHILNRPIPKTARLGLLSLLAVVAIAAILLPMAAAAERSLSESRTGPLAIRFVGVCPDQSGEILDAEGRKIEEMPYPLGSRPVWASDRLRRRDFVFEVPDTQEPTLFVRYRLDGPAGWWQQTDHTPLVPVQVSGRRLLFVSEDLPRVWRKPLLRILPRDIRLDRMDITLGYFYGPSRRTRLSFAGPFHEGQAVPASGDANGQLTVLPKQRMMPESEPRASFRLQAPVVTDAHTMIVLYDTGGARHVGWVKGRLPRDPNTVVDFMPMDENLTLAGIARIAVEEPYEVTVRNVHVDYPDRPARDQIMVVRWMAVLEDGAARRVLSEAQPVASQSKSYQGVQLGSEELLARVKDCGKRNQILYLVEDLKWLEPSPKYLRADSWSYSTNLNHPVYVGCTTGGAGPYKLDVHATEAKLDLQSESVNCDLNPGVRAEGSIFFKGSLPPGQALVFAAPLQKDGQTVATHLVVWQAVRVPKDSVKRVPSIRSTTEWIEDGPSLLIAQVRMPLPELAAHEYYQMGEPIRVYVHGKITSWKSDTDDILRKGGWPRAFLRIDDKEYACLPVFGPFESAGRTLDIPEELQMNPANFHLPLGRHTAVYGWRDVNVIDPNDPGQPVRFTQLVTNPVQFEVVEQLPADYYRPVYQEGWENILRRSIQTPFTDAPEKHGVAGPLLTLRVRPLPFDVAFEIYTQAEGSEQRQYAAQVPIKAGSTSDYITGCSRNVEGLNWDTVGDRRWRLILVPSEKVAAWNPPIHEFYGREFTTDWVSFERSPQFEQNRLSLMRFQNDEAHSGDAVKADKPVAEAATKRRIYLPDLKTPGPNTVLDLGTGEPLSAKPMDQDPGYLDKLGKGDIAYEYVGGKSALLCFRGTRILSVSAPPSSNRGTRKISAPDVEQSGFVVYFIVPRGRYLIQTAEGNRYELNVLEFTSGVRGGALVEFTKADAGGGALDKLTKEESAGEAGIAPHGVNIYLLADEGIDLKTARAKPLAELVLRKEPWIASADIERYDLSTHAIYLKSNKPIPFQSVALRGSPFVVTAEGQRCYLGSLWTHISSFLPEQTTPLIYFPRFSPPDIILIEGIVIWSGSGEPAQDVRQDPRVIQALAANGQLHGGLEINLDRVEVLPREGGSSLRYTYTLRNKDSDDLYVFDPNKMSPWLFHYFNVPFLLSMRDHKGFQADTSLLKPPATVPDQLDMAWLSLLRSTASMTRTVTVPAFRDIPPDRYICSFRFGSPGRLATKDKRERTDGRIWLGQIGASMSLDTGPGEKTASTLELHIAPTRDELGSDLVEEFRKALVEGRTPADSRYLWVPVRAGTNLRPDLATQTHEGKTWLLVHNDNPFIMVPAQGWRLAQVARSTDESGRPMVTLEFDDAGAERMSQLTKAHGGHPLAMIVNGVIVSAPMILEGRGGFSSTVIPGNFTEQELEDMIAALSKGIVQQPAEARAGTRTVRLDMNDHWRMLDLATGEFISTPRTIPLPEIKQELQKLGKADLMYDYEQGKGKLILLRGAASDQAKEVTAGSFPTCLIGSSLPEVLTVTTAEGRQYKITILSADDKACLLRYSPVPADKGTGGGTLAEPGGTEAGGKPPAAMRPGPPGRYALSFDGVQDRLIVPPSPSLGLRSAFSIEIWVQPDFSSSDGRPWVEMIPLQKGRKLDDPDKEQADGFLLRLAGSPLQPELQCRTSLWLGKSKGGLSQAGFAYRQAPWRPGWYCFCVRCDGRNHVPVPDQPLVIGGLSMGDSLPFKGKIGQIRIWNRVLTDAEIRRYGATALTGKEPNLVACWTFQEGSGRVVHDISPNHNDAHFDESSGRADAGPKWVTLSPAPEPGQAGSTLELCVAPKAGVVGGEVGWDLQAECETALFEGRTPADNRFVWVAARPGASLSPHVLSRAHNGTTWLLTRTDGPYRMVPDQGWRLAHLRRDPDGTDPSTVALEFEGPGAERLLQRIRPYAGHALAIVVNGLVVSAPLLLEDRPLQRALIVGGLAEQGFKDTVATLGEDVIGPPAQTETGVKPPATVERGPVGRYALAFDGLDDCVTIPPSPSLRLKPPFSIEVWAKPDFSEVQALPRGETRARRWPEMTFIRQGKKPLGTPGASVDGIEGEGRSRVRPSLFGGLSTGFVGCLSDEKGGMLYGLRDDGILLQENPFRANRLSAGPPGWVQYWSFIGTIPRSYTPADGPLVIGGQTVPDRFVFRGAIARICLWNRELTSEEARYHASRSVTGNEPNLVACWTFSEGSGQIVHDISPNHNDAYLGNSKNADDADPKWIDLTQTTQLSANEISGWVVDPNGKPVAGAQAALCTEKMEVVIKNGILEQPGIGDAKKKQIVETDAEGRFRFEGKPPEDFDVIAAAHEAGFALMASDEFSKNREIRLERWGRIEGQLAKGREALENQVWMAGLPNSTWLKHRRDFRYDTRCGAEGRFVFERVPAGWFEVGFLAKTGDMFSSPTSRTPVVIKAGATATMRLGGEGRPVIGRFVPPAGYKGPVYFGAGLRSLETVRLEPPRPANYNQMSRQEQQDWYWQWRQTPEYQAYSDSIWHNPDWRSYTFRIQENGTFRIEDVIPGQYDLTVWLEERFTGRGRMEEIGAYKGTVEVPALPGGRTEEPLNLSDLTVGMNKPPLHAGDMAPLFEVKTLDGKDLRLADYRGKFVLLSFWQPQFHPELDRLKELHKTYGGTGKLQIIGLGGSDTLEEVTKYVAEHQIEWPEMYLSPKENEGVTGQYALPGLPYILLVNPEGKIVATWLRGEKLMQAVTDVIDKTN